MTKLRPSHVSSEEFRDLFPKRKPLRIADIAGKLQVDRSTVTRQMRKHRTFTSINCNAAFCVLPTACRFDALGFCKIGPALFFRDGNQLDAIVRLVEASDKGMDIAAINATFTSKCAMQALSLVRNGRLQRHICDTRYVYFAAGQALGEKQFEQWQGRVEKDKLPRTEETVVALLAEESREGLELLVKLLLTCLRHPQFNAKSLALSLVRRGEKTCTKQVQELLDRFAFGKKNSRLYYWR